VASDFVLILMTSRSGSSLVSKIFHAHGWDHGGERYFSCGYETFENVAVKRFIDANKHRIHTETGKFCNYIPGVEACVPDHRGLVKIGVEYAGLFERMNPHVVTVKRDPVAVAKSLTDKRGNPHMWEKTVPAIRARYKGLDRAVRRWGGAEVNTDQLVKGDLTSIRAAFEHHGFAFNEDIARRCIRPEIWHKW